MASKVTCELQKVGDKKQEIVLGENLCMFRKKCWQTLTQNFMLSLSIGIVNFIGNYLTFFFPR